MLTRAYSCVKNAIIKQECRGRSPLPGFRGAYTGRLLGGGPQRCRDKEQRSGWEGALCLSWLGNRTDTEDKHKAPASAPHRPLSLRKWQAWRVDRTLAKSKN